MAVTSARQCSLFRDPSVPVVPVHVIIVRIEMIVVAGHWFACESLHVDPGFDSLEFLRLGGCVSR